MTIGYPITTAELQSYAGEYGAHSLPLNSSSNVLASSLLVKAGTGTLFGVSVFNSKASAQFVQLFDLAVLPADGAVPTATFTVAASSNLGLYFGSVGRSFNAGILLCNSSTAATKTIGSADCFFDAQYI